MQAVFDFVDVCQRDSDISPGSYKLVSQVFVIRSPFSHICNLNIIHCYMPGQNRLSISKNCISLDAVSLEGI